MQSSLKPSTGSAGKSGPSPQPSTMPPAPSPEVPARAMLRADLRKLSEPR